METESTTVVNKIVEFNEFESKLVEYKAKFKGVVYDLSDTSQQEQAKSDKKAIAKVIKNLDDIHKSVKSELLTKTRLIDGERKRIKDDLIEIKDDINDQLEEHANIAIKHAAMLNEMVEAIARHSVFEDGVLATIEDLEERLNLANMIVVDDRFESREADGHMAKAKAIESLESRIALAEKQNRIAKEEKVASEKAQQEREDQIRKDVEFEAAKEKEIAARKAKNDAEIAKKIAKEDKILAVNAEKEKAKKSAKEKEIAARKEVERLQALDDEESKKVKAKQENQTHRAKLHKKIKEALISENLVSDEDHAVKLVKFLIESKNVTINY